MLAILYFRLVLCLYFSPRPGFIIRFRAFLACSGTFRHDRFLSGDLVSRVNFERRVNCPSSSGERTCASTTIHHLYFRNDFLSQGIDGRLCTLNGLYPTSSSASSRAIKFDISSQRRKQASAFQCESEGRKGEGKGERTRVGRTSAVILETYPRYHVVQRQGEGSSRRAS